ncbi:MAG TPA: hypothetical protein VGU66_14900 [Candidatus Elarobacter sp.]|nr:hypothetical protein [Candidatus Elarobacter sp.]
MRFSQRIGVKPIRSVIQQGAIDTALRNSLWNVFRDFIPESAYRGWNSATQDAKRFFDAIWRDFFKNAVDNVPNGRDLAVAELRSWWLDAGDATWDEIYDIVEFGISIIGQKASYIKAVNAVLSREMSAYRVVAGQLQTVIDEVEIASIEEAISGGGDTVRVHITTAIKYLSDRSAPDYRNSIKESISAVEAAVRDYTGGEETLGAAIAKIQKTQPMHPAFASALSKLYGYTSDEGGIRHSLTDEAVEPTQAEAQFMLVACSAFVNLLKASTAR